MRYILMTIAMMLAAAVSMSADEKADETLRRIESENADVETLQGRFVHGRTANDGSHEVYEGMLYVGKDNMAMHYDKADQELFMIEGNKIHMIRKGKTRDVNLKIIKPMTALKTTLLYSMQGKVASLAESQPSYDVKVSENSEGIVVEFKSRKKSGMGYEIIRNTYDSDSFMLKRMEMIEFNGNSNTYTIGAPIANKQINPNIFDIDRY